MKLKHGLAPLLWMNKKSNLETSQCCLLYIIPVRVKATRMQQKGCFHLKKSFRVYLSGIELHVFLFVRENENGIF